MDLPDFPTRHVPLEHPGGPRMAGALELAAPLALGQRGLVVAPARCGATTVLRWLGLAVCTHLPEAHVTALLVDQPIEEFQEWRDALPGAAVVGTASDQDATQHAALIEPFHAAARLAAVGTDAVLLVDSLAALARALAATTPVARGEQVHDSGVPHSVLRELRGLFGLARAGTAGGGSLTVLATVRIDSSNQLDELLLHELVGTGNVEWRLDGDAMQAGAFPPVDVLASGARRTELILGEEEAERRGRMRAIVDERGIVGGAGELLVQLDIFGSLEQVMDDALQERWSPGGGSGRIGGAGISPDDDLDLSDVFGES